MPKRGCRTPTVYNCLHCEKPECDVVDSCPLHESEIMAEVNAGILSIKALWQHQKRAKQRQNKPKPQRGRDDY